MNRIIYIFCMLLVMSAHSAEKIYDFHDERKEAQFKSLLADLRCLVCQNQDLLDSNSPLAADLRDEVYSLVQEGKSDNEIFTYLTSRYGDYILFKPPIKGSTYVLWFGPLLFVLIGAILLRRHFARNSV